MSRHRRPGAPRTPVTDRELPSWLKRVLLGAVVVVALGLLVLGWLGYTGVRARSELDAAKADVSRLRAALLAGDRQDADAALADARVHADAARGLTGDVLWRAVAHTPYFGRTARATTVVTATLAATADDVLPGLLTAAQHLDPQTLRQGDRIDLAVVRAATPAVDAARRRLAPLRQQLAGLELDGVLPTVAAGVASLERQMGRLTGDLDSVGTAAHLLAPMLGGSATRHYLVVFQNEAEARGTGGLVGAYAVVSATAGRVTVDSLGSDTDLRSAAQPVLDLGPAYRRLFGSDTALWANTNLSAHFPSAALQQLELWRRQHGQRLDGVIAVDPVLLGYLLDATGPTTLRDGTAVDGSDVAELTMSRVYARFPTAADTVARKAFLQSVAAAALARVLSGEGDAADLLRALGDGVDQRRLLIFSAHPDEESLIAPTGVSGVVDSDPGPYAALAVNNGSGSKIDYYLDRTLSYVRACPETGSDEAESTVTLTLTDGAPSHGLPPYVTYRLDRGPIDSPAGRGGDGSVRENVLVYVAMGARLAGATVDGAPLEITTGTDGQAPGRPVITFALDLRAGQTRTVVLHLLEPAVDGTARAWVQPLVREPEATVAAPSCR